MITHGRNAAGRFGRLGALLLLAVVAGAVLIATLGAHAARPRTSARGPVTAPASGRNAPAPAPVHSPSSQTISGLPADVAAGAAESAQGPYRLGEVLVGFRSGVSAPRQLAIERAAGAHSARRLGPAIKPVGNGRTASQEYLAPMELRVGSAQVMAVIHRLQQYPEIAYAEPNYLQRGSAKPNDPEFAKQWGDENTGQPIPFQDQSEKLGAEEKGTPGAEDHVNQAWEASKGSRSIVIGEVDTGVAYEHSDLAANIWSAPPGGINGCAAGTHGYNVLAKSCNPIDEDSTYNGHGTHVAGIMGAIGNNGIGVAGMNWETTILPVRWMNNASSGETSSLIEALQWLVSAKQAGVNLRVVNDSDTFFGTAKSEALSKAVETLGANNILFVTAAGNTGNNNDEEKVQRYPCSYDRANEICVTATNNKDQLPTWANYGSHTVQLAAPGVSIYSTLRGNSYGWLSGGSMASPQVAGAAALILSVSPSMNTTELRADILNSVDKLPSLEGKIETGGRLNVCRALPGCKSELPPPPKEKTVGYKEIGGSKDNFASERKRVNRYALPTSGSVTKLSVYLEPGPASSSQQVMKGVIYSDISGKPEKLLGVSEQLTFKHENAAGWYDLPFSSPLNLSAGNYWIGVITGPTNGVAGFRWTSVSNARNYNANAYSSGPTNPFGAVSTDGEQTSLYATYIAVPVNAGLPTISGEARQGQTLSEAHGTWANEPTSYSYKWQQCDSVGNNCAGIGGATAPTYAPIAGDVGHTLRVQETASNAEGSSSAASSAATAVVKQAPPAIGTPPTITGEARQGKTLTEVHGTWTNNPTSYAYQWQQCSSEGTSCSNIPGANKQEYVPVEGDVGHKLRSVETATNAGGSGEASSAATEVIKPLPPSNTALPTIEGKAQVGQTLTEVHGKWANNPTGYAYQWLQCTSLGEGCLPITGATKQTYEPAAGDVGHTLRVLETATNPGGSGEATSAATAVVLPLPPAPKAPPTIEGKAQQGQTLAEHHGEWTNNPATYSYQWLQCTSLGEGCLPIAGATKQTYEPVAGDVGHTLRALETATNAGGSGEAVSAATAVVLPPPPTPKAPPTIEGKAQQGHTLAEHHGEWTNEPTSFAYQWQQCNSEGTSCSNIPGANKQEYVPVEGDVGHKLRIVETATNAGGSGEATSAATAVVVPPPPSNTGLPTIEGKVQQSQTLSEVHGTWTNNPTSYTYQWLQCDGAGNKCTNISGAEGQKYVPVEGDVGHKLRMQETAANAGGISTPATSEPIGVVTPLVPVNKKPPTIVDPAQQGQTMTEGHGEWANNPTGYAYQWLQCDSEGNNCTSISAATAQTYTPEPSDVGHRIRVQEIASNPAGSSVASTSEPTEVIKPPAPKCTSPPTITGEARQGQTLTEHHGSCTNNPTSYAYKWQQCDSVGNSCTNIPGAEGQTYLPVEGDVGHKLRVVETATNAGGSGEATSAATEVIKPLPPSNTGLPTITGEARQGKTLTEVHGTWTNNPTSYSYQWQQCNAEVTSCSNIPVASKQEYVPVEGDVGHKLRVVETATNAGGSGEATSVATAVVLPLPPSNAVLPTIEGKVQQGQTLTEVHGTWANNPTSYSYKWQQCDSAGNNCANITGAEGQKYVPVEGDVGRTLKVQEIATNAGGSGEATSAATAVVVPPPPAPKAPPAIEGKAQQGQTLAEHHGEWTNNPTSYSYQWLQCTSLGEGCLPISGATKPTYEPVAGDVSHTLRVQEMAGNAGGTSEAATSEPTAVVLPAPPVNEKPPTTTGTAQQGQTLTEHNGTWTNSPTGFSYQWVQCNSEGANCTPIPGATKQTYEPVAGDVGHALRVQETANNAGGTSTPAISEATPVVLPAPPVNEKTPTITGTAQQGQTLTEHNGAWTNSPTGYIYQWEQCEALGNACLPIAGATKQTYVLVSADVGHTIRVQETASNAGGAGAPVVSEPTAIVLFEAARPTPETKPKISGTAEQGRTLTEQSGSWTNGPTSFSYQWLQCDGSGNTCTPISGATKQSYEVVSGDVGHRLRVQEEATNAYGTSNPEVSEPTAVVVPPPPVTQTPPTITGVAKQGEKLTEVHGTWTNEPTSYTYQWLQCSAPNICASISGATSQTYVPVAGDVGHTIEVQEIATNAGGSSEAATSAATESVLPAAPAGGTPAVSGTAQQEKVLSEIPGSWTNNPTSFSYQWLQCDGAGNSCAAISGATKQTYSPVAGDVGHKLRVQETASNAGGSSEPATSEATAVVVPPVPVNVGGPAISGNAQQGQALNETHGTWTNEPTSFTYQWLQCNGEGNSCAAISGATKQTYSPVAADVGHKLRVQETASNAGGSSEPATSEASAVVLPAPPVNTALPTISGSAQQEKVLSEIHGTWTNNPTSFSYQWLQCNGEGNSCAAISGATKQTYSPVAGDVGHKLRLQETASNAGGSSEPATSEATAAVVPPVPVSTGAPTISGNAQQGQALNESHGTWTNEPTSFTYQWLQCDGAGNSCAAISGATKQAYSPAAADVGHRLRVQETASNAGGSSEQPATSEASAVVLPAAPVSLGPPTISGTVQQGKPLTEAQGKWSNEPTTFTYQWLQCESTGGGCLPISGATTPAYVPVAGDVGHKLRVQETASNAGGSSEPATSEATPAVLPPVPVSTGAPTISGNAQQSQLLNESHGTWTNEPTSFTYQWLQCDGAGNSCAAISGATKQAYSPVAADVGHRLRVQETASNAGGSSEQPATSEATAVILTAPPVNGKPPTISGAAQQEKVLTEIHGTWSNSPSGFSYQWLQCNGEGNSCAVISGATKQTYSPVAGDVGHKLRVQETASNAGGTGEPATSGPTEVVQVALATFGKATVGASKDVFAGGRKRVNRYALTIAGAVTKLTVYLAPTSNVGQQVMKGIIYADEGGAPTALLGVSEQLTFTNTNKAEWYDLHLATPVKLAAGNYWIGVITGSTANIAGFRYDSVAGSRAFNANAYSSGPSNPFGAVTVDPEQTSLYATYAPGG